MNIAAEHPHPAAQLARALDLSVRLWRDGRSVAGIIMEVEQELGLQMSPRRLLQRLKRRRKAGAPIPPALYTPADFRRAREAGEPLSILDQRADLTAQWRMEHTRRYGGPAYAH